MSEIRFLTKDLPSKGIFYPDIEVLTLRKFTLKDIEAFSNEERSLKELITDFKKDVKGIEPDKVLYMDFLYMSLFRTASIYNNNKLKFNLSCPYCKEVQDVEIEYDKVELFDFDDYIDLFPLNLDVKGENIEFNLPSLKVIEDLITYQEKKSTHETYVEMKKEDIESFSKEERIYFKSLETKEIEMVKKDEILLIENPIKLITYGLLSSSDTAHVIELLKDIEDVDIIEALDLLDEISSSAFKIYVTSCKSCKNELKISLEGVATLLKPFRTSTKSIADKIRNSKKLKSKHKSNSRK